MRITGLKLAATAVLMAGAQQAFALGTAAGNTITNTASLAYSVGGVAQNAVTGTDTFTVDRKIDLTVAEIGTVDTNVVPGSNLQVLSFTVTNTGNARQDFLLTTTADATNATTAHGGTDDFDATNVQIYLDNPNAGTVGAFDNQDILATFIDGLAADASRTVFIVASIPAGQTNGQQAGYILSAQAAESGATPDGAQGAAVVQTAANVADGQNTLETIFADAATTDANGSEPQTRFDGRASDDDTYLVVTAAITVNKTSTVITDPVTCTTPGNVASCGGNSPKRIPNAVVEYCLQVVNGSAGGAPATNMVLTDNLTALPVDFVNGSLVYVASAAGVTCASAGATNTDAADADAGSYDTTTKIVTGNLADVAANQASVLRFRVTIQ